MPLPGWMPSLLNSISSGCANSPLFRVREDNDDAMVTGRQLCIDLWPFIEDLPANIACVRDAVPSHMESARKLLSQLADDERTYQQMFRRQCHLAGLTDTELAQLRAAHATEYLCQVMRRYCRSKNFHDGVFAVVTAEFAATAFSRHALPLFERYFTRNADNYDINHVDEGLAWLRHHTQQHTKHALWLRRMLGEMGDLKSDVLPEPVESVLAGVLGLWKSNPDKVLTATGNLSLANN